MRRSGRARTGETAVPDGLYRLSKAGLLPRRYQILATSRGDMSDDDFRAFAYRAVAEFSDSGPDDDAWASFAAALAYVNAGDPARLTHAVEQAERDFDGAPRRLHYLSVPPAAAPGIVHMLGSTGLGQRARVIMEKPFGFDLATARALNSTVHGALDESQIFRIDHFLGKETVQNVLALRFANPIFELIWNRRHIDYVQIDVPETLSIGTRAKFYEATGAFRDMVVTHLLQVLGFVAMEPPESLHSDALVHETTRVFEALAPLRREDVVRGQYADTSTSRGSRRTRPPRRSSPCGPTWTTPARRESRSTCALASVWPRAGAS